MKILLSTLLFIGIINSNKAYSSSPYSYNFLFQKEQKILTIESEPENGKIHELTLILDENHDILDLKRTTKNSTDQSTFTFDQIIEGQISLAEMKHTNGQDLRPVLLSCDNCDRTRGGDILIKYLRSGINPNRLRYRDFEVELRRVDDNWLLFQKDKVVKKVKLVSRKLMGQLVGIKKIIVNP